MPVQVLIVEDDVNFGKLLELRLRAWNPDLQIIFARTLAEARSLLEVPAYNFSFVILDQHLPDGTGHELLEHPKLSNVAALAISSDTAAELPGQTVRAGAQHFLSKNQISEPLFIPLVEAILERKKLELALMQARLKESKMKTITTLLATLRHEINNPLGALFGATYLVQREKLGAKQQEAVRLIEESSKRIQHVLEQLCDAAELEEVTKAQQSVYHVPGDPEWGETKTKK